MREKGHQPQYSMMCCLVCQKQIYQKILGKENPFKVKVVTEVSTCYSHSCFSSTWLFLRHISSVISESTVCFLFSPTEQLRGVAEKSDWPANPTSTTKPTLSYQELFYEFRAALPAALLTSRSLVRLPDFLPSPPGSEMSLRAHQPDGDYHFMQCWWKRGRGPWASDTHSPGRSPPGTDIRTATPVMNRRNQPPGASESAGPPGTARWRVTNQKTCWQPQVQVPKLRSRGQRCL